MLTSPFLLPEAIPKMGDAELFQACAEADPLSQFALESRHELVGNRRYSESDIEDEIDRVLYWRARRGMEGAA